MVAQAIAQWFFAVSAVSYITFVICSSGIMASTRQWIRAQAQREGFLKTPFHHLKRMVGCPFCAGFWVTVGVEAVYRINVFAGTDGLLWNALSIPAIVMPAAMIAFAGSVMVGQVHKVLDAMDQAEATLREAQRGREESMELPESMRV